jgi:hypothetical protein
LKYRFIDFSKVAFCVIQKADNELSGPFDHLKHRFLDHVQIAFLDAQKAKSEFAWPIDPLKHRFIEYTQVVFSADYKTENEFSGRLHPLIKRLLHLAYVTFWVCKGRQFCRRLFRNHETSLYRLQLSRKFEVQNAGNDFLVLFHHLNYRFIDFNNVAFCDIQKADNEFSGPFHHLKHCFLDLVETHFLMTRKSKIISHGRSTPRNIAFTT